MNIVSTIEPSSDKKTERIPPKIEYSTLKTIVLFKKEGLYNAERLRTIVEGCICNNGHF